MNPGAGQPPKVTAAGRAESVLLSVLLIIVAALTGSTPAAAPPADQAVTMALTASSAPMLTQPAAAPHSHLVSAVIVREVENAVGPSARKLILLVGPPGAVSADHVGSVSSGGWTSRVSGDGAVTIFEKDGAKYVLRSKNSSGYAGWTADFTPAGSTKHILELRLGYPQ